MATEFAYVKEVNTAALSLEIAADAGITTALDFIVVDGTDLHIHFVTDLSAGEITALDALVAAHTGVPSVQPGTEEPPPPGVDESDPTDGGLSAVDKQKVVATSTVSTTSSSFVDLPGMVFSTKDLGSTDGCYLIFFTGIFKIGEEASFAIRITVGGVEVHKDEFSTGEADYNYSGQTLVHLESGLLNESEIKVQWKKVSGSTLFAKRRELVVLGVPTSQVLS